MSDVVIYTTPWCPYCYRAKALLQRKGVVYQEKDVFFDTARRQEMLEKSAGRTSVPQIFIKGVGIGGCDELHALEEQGRLTELLAEEGE